MRLVTTHCSGFVNVHDKSKNFWIIPDTKVVLTDYLWLGSGWSGRGHPGPWIILSPLPSPQSDLLVVMSDIVDGLLAILASNLE